MLGKLFWPYATVLLLMCFFPKANSAEVLSGIIEGSSVEIVTNFDESIIKKNPDGTKFSKSTIEVTIKGYTKIVLDDGIYSNPSIKPSAVFDSKAKKLIIFALSYSGNNYDMNGVSFVVDYRTTKFSKEYVFSRKNYGWYSYFGGSISGNPELWHFSFDGYRQMKSVRSSNGSWSNEDYGHIVPLDAESIYKKRNLFLVASDMDIQSPGESIEDRIRTISARKAEEVAFNNSLNNSNPQLMYLSAGKYERMGESYKSKQIYERLIERFPASPWAVKANDQLNDSKRANDAESAANQRQYNAQRAAQDADSRSKIQCGIRISHCEDSCSPLSGSSKTSCWNSCKSLCNQF